MNKLACLYSIVRYVPDLVKNEARNIGVIVQCRDAGFIDCKFLTNLHYKLGTSATNVDNKIIKAYINEFSSKFKHFSSFPSTNAIFSEEFLKESYLDDLANNGLGKIQFTNPQGCLADNPKEELEYLFKSYIGDEYITKEKKVKRTRLKTELRNEFKKRKILVTKTKDKKGYFRENVEIIGKRSKVKHSIDFALDNGKLYLIETVDMRKKLKKSWELETYGAAVKFDDLTHGHNNNLKSYSIVAMPDNDINGHRYFLKILEAYSTVVQYTEEKEKSEFLFRMSSLVNPTENLY